MNKVIAGLFAAALMGTTFVMADVGAPSPASKDLKKIVEEGPYVETSQKGITLSGYVDAGYQYNFNGRGEDMSDVYKFGNEAATAGDNKGRGDFDLNAVKLALEKPLTDANELQAGFRIDAMLGEDAAVLGQNAGGSDSIFLEQAYVQFRLPYGNGIDFKVGKFVSPLGYEVIERPVNMNITYGNIFANNLVPRWHTGFLGSYRVNDIVDLKFGIANGSNNDNGLGAGTADDNAALLAAINLTVPGGNANWYQAVMYAINGDAGIADMAGNKAGLGSDDSPTIVYDTWMNWKPKCCKDKLLLGLNANLGHAPVFTGIGATQDNYTTWFGLASYIKYKFNDIFSLANRIDYIHNDDSHAFGNTVDNRQDIWSETMTASFDVIENMMLRTEYRLDWGKDYTETLTAPVHGIDGPIHSAAVQVVYSF
jgi:hypothetical protein